LGPLNDPELPETSIESVTEFNETLAVFRSSLQSQSQALRENKRLLAQFPEHIRDDVVNFQVSSAEPPRGGIYDISIYERTIFLSRELLRNFGKYWHSMKIDPKDQERMCQLYFLHEFHHIEQKVDSNTYPYSKNSKTIFQPLDYSADAFAVKLCFLIEECSFKAEEFSNWQRRLADILHAHIRGGEIFSVLDDGSQFRIDGPRLHRQLIWHLQYARAYLFKPEATLNEFDIDKHVALELFKIEEKERRSNLCAENEVTQEDFRKPLELHILRGNVRLRFALTISHSLTNLSEGLFTNNMARTVEAFRPFFDDHPEWLGRSLTNPLSFMSKVEDRDELGDEWWEKLEDVVVSLYSQGLLHNEIWSRSGGDLADVNLNLTGKGSWHSALRSLRKGGGGQSITALSLLRKMLQDYPANDDLKGLYASKGNRT
jgi:hypothetical protein